VGLEGEGCAERPGEASAEREEVARERAGELASLAWGGILESTQGQFDGFFSNSHTNATRIGWHLWDVDLRFAPVLPPGWREIRACQRRRRIEDALMGLCLTRVARLFST